MREEYIAKNELVFPKPDIQFEPEPVYPFNKLSHEWNSTEIDAIMNLKANTGLPWSQVEEIMNGE